MAWVYILGSERGKYYVGSTNNLLRRLKEHQSGRTITTKRLGSVTLLLSQVYPTLAQARKVERALKKLKRRDYIEKILKDGYIRMTPP